MTEFPLIIQDLTKKFVREIALNKVSFSVPENKIFGLIGPDGAGKTTLIRILATLMSFDSGEILFQDKSIIGQSQYIRKNIGYMPQRFSLYQDLSVAQNLRFFGDLFNVPITTQKKRIEELYSFSKLAPFSQRKAGDLSGGMKQKLALSCILMHEPKILILDEPTVGVDAVSRFEFWDILHNLSEQGATILVSTSYMEEAEQCYQVGLIYKGSILAQGKPDKLIEEYPYPLYKLKTTDTYQTYSKLHEQDLGKNSQLFGDTIHIADTQNTGLKNISKSLKQLGITICELLPTAPNLEDLFLYLIQRKSENG
ncbi:ABC transporter ATP-binding protein [Candidatus Margulisiibacteriota bacterium]